MKAPRLHELTARVVAWHNRHPLAQRIGASQVHSIGEVQLPFVAAQAWGGAADMAAPPPAPAPARPDQGPTLAQALAQRNARQAAAAPAAEAAGSNDIDLALEAPIPGAAVVDADAAVDSADSADAQPALVKPLAEGEEAPTDLPAPAAAATAADPDPDTAPGDAMPAAAEALPVASDAVYPPPHGPVPASDLARAVQRRAAAQAAPQHAAPQQAAASIGPAAPPAGRWQRLTAALRRALTGRQAGLPALHATFNSDFIWPLQTAQVARWAQRHGQPLPLAPADWPRRTIDTDRIRQAALRQQGLAHDLPLHVLTAAIGVGDRRIRLLVGADGSVLGPRAYSRARLGSASMVLAVGLVGLGWTLRPLHGLPADAAAMAAAAHAASPASAVPALVASASASASASAAASAAGDTASATSLAYVPSAASAASAADGTVAAAPPDDSASQPQASIRPALSDEDKSTARAESARLRGGPLPAPPATLIEGPVYAVVGPASRQREVAAGSLAQMQATAGRLGGSAPEHGELLQSQGLWRAAWWPFPSLVDAERARVLLAGRGIKAEVVEF